MNPLYAAGWQTFFLAKIWRSKSMGQMMQDDPVLITSYVTRVLEYLKVPYFLVGSLASALYGMVRSTQDSDLVAKLLPEQIQPFVEALEPDFFVDESMIADSISRHSSFNIIHRASMFKVDVFIPRESDFLRKRYSRAKKELLSNHPKIEVMVASAEDTVLSKLEWYRLGGEVSERHWRDALGVLKVQAGALDLDYLRQMAAELKVTDLLERALKEA